MDRDQWLEASLYIELIRPRGRVERVQAIMDLVKQWEERPKVDMYANYYESKRAENDRWR